MNVDNLISGSSAFSKCNLYIWKFSVRVLLKPSLKDFEQYLVSMWNENNCIVVWPFFGIALLWDWKESWSFLVLWPLLSFLALNLPQHQGLFQWVSVCIRWPKNWSFSFSINPSNEYSGNIQYQICWSHYFMANRWRNNGNRGRLYFSGLQNDYRWWLQPWN